MKLHKSYIFFLISVLFAFTYSPLFSQDNEIAKKFDEFRKENYQEKVYVTTDREFYISGEIIWFKVYGLDGSLHSPSDVSRIVYVELVGTDSVAHLQAKVDIKGGNGSGSFYIPTSLNSGKYLLRAYTNWMKNFDAAFFFQKDLTIVNTFKSISNISSVKNVKLQFYPEGGHLVADIESKVAFQAINPSGEGVEFAGKLINGTGDTLLSFNPTVRGMGSFSFTPKAGEIYKAVIESDGNNYYALIPEIYETGYVLSVKSDGDNVVVSVTTNRMDDNVYLLSHGRNILTHSLKKPVRNGKANITINKNELVEGINHFTIFNEANKPVAERLYFKKPANLMNVELGLDKSSYSKMEKVKLDISTIQIPITNLSASVFKLDSLNQEPEMNIINYLYLLSDLKGNVRDANYYVSQNVKEPEIDLLMLTHGWSRFNWDQVLNFTYSYKNYIPEVKGHLLQGSLLNKETKQPAEGILTYLTLTGGKPRFHISKSNDAGKIKFEVQDYYGMSDIILSTNYLEDSIYHFEVSNPFSKEYSWNSVQEVSFTEESRGSLISRSIGMQTLNIYQEENVNLFSPSTSDSTLFFVEGDKQYLLDNYTRFTTMEDVMREYVPNVWVRSSKGDFNFRILDVERDFVYKNNPLILYDGMPIFDVNKVMKVDPLKVERLDVVTKRYFYGRNSFDGIVSYKSYKENLDGIQMDHRALVMEYDFAQLEREFYSPEYNETDNITTPDLRNLLFWNADIKTDEKGMANMEFYASEETGTYLIIVEGISEDGKPGYSSLSFEVKDKSK